jgi:hypothetical protein
MYQEKIVKIATFFILITFSNVAFSQKIERYKAEIFSKYDSLTNIQYGEATNLKGESEKLLLDIYSPSADVLKKGESLKFGANFPRRLLKYL